MELYGKLVHINISEKDNSFEKHAMVFMLTIFYGFSL